MYKKITGSKGDRWLKDGKFIKASEVPKEVKQNFITDDEIKGKCLVCGESPDHKRNILGMIVEVCDKDYYSPQCTYGYLAGILKKKGLYGSN